MRTEQDSFGISLNRPFVVALCIMGVTLRLNAHVGDVVYPFTEITDEMLEMMDLTDGSIEDWETMMGEPTLNLLGFTRLEHVPRDGGGVTLALASRDPADWDVRVWLGWHRGTGRLYVAAQVSDDRFVGGFDGEQTGSRCAYDCIALYIDGDHSGGDTRLTSYQQAQYYSAVPEAPAGLYVGLEGRSQEDWMDQPPYAEGGGAARGENPTYGSWSSRSPLSTCCPRTILRQVLPPISAPGRQSASISGSTIWIPNRRIGESFIIFSGLRILPRTDSATASCLTGVSARSSSRSPGPGSRPPWRSLPAFPDGDALPDIAFISPPGNSLV